MQTPPFSYIAYSTFSPSICTVWSGLSLPENEQKGGSHFYVRLKESNRRLSWKALSPVKLKLIRIIKLVTSAWYFAVYKIFLIPYVLACEILLLSPFNRWENKVLQGYLPSFPQSSSRAGPGIWVSQLWLVLCSERDCMSLYHTTLFRRQPLGHRIQALWPPSGWPSLTHASTYSQELARSSAREMSDERLNKEFPGSPGVKVLHFHCSGLRFSPLWELRSHKPRGSEYNQTKRLNSCLPETILSLQLPEQFSRAGYSQYRAQNHSRELAIIRPFNRKGNQGWVRSWKLQTWGVWHQSLSFWLPSATNHFSASTF